MKKVLFMLIAAILLGTAMPMMAQQKKRTVRKTTAVKRTKSSSKTSTKKGLTSLTYSGPAFVDGQLAFMGIPLSGYEQEIKPKLIKTGLKIRDKDSLEGVIEGVPVYIIIQGNSLWLYETADYKLSQANSRLGFLLRKLEPIYGKANLTFDEEEAKGYEIKTGEHTISVGYHNADELEMASDYYDIVVVFR